MTRHQLIAGAVVVFLLTGVWFSSRDTAPPAGPVAGEEPSSGRLPLAEAVITTAPAVPSLTASPTLIVLTFQPEPTLAVGLSPTLPAVLPAIQPTDSPPPAAVPSPITENQLPAATEPPTSPPPPTVTVAPPPPPPADPSAASAEQNVIDQVNYQRSLYGLPPYARNETLMQIARGRSADMAARGYFSHFDPVTGLNAGRSQVLQAGFANGSENIWRSGQGLADMPVQSVGWFMTDQIHADAILHTAYSAVGAGIAADGPYWILTVLFGS